MTTADELFDQLKRLSVRRKVVYTIIQKVKLMGAGWHSDVVPGYLVKFNHSTFVNDPLASQSIVVFDVKSDDGEFTGHVNFVMDVVQSEV